MSMLLMFITVSLVAVLTLAATSVRAVSRLWLRHWVEREGRAAGTLARYLERPTRLLHAAATGVTLVVFTGGAFLAMADGSSPWRLLLDVVVFIVLLIGIGQLLPRAIARRWATVILPVMVPLLRVIDLVVSPFLFVARFVTDQVMRRRPAPAEAEAREGIEDLLREGALEDLGATEEMAIISGVVQFGEKCVADVMTPRADIFALDESLSADEVARQVAAAAYSRVPIYRGSLDDIVGMIHAFDVFREAGERLPMLRPVAITTPERAANELLFELLRARRQLAIVRDSSLRVLGIVTLEDLLEELVGDIRDEHDEPAPRAPGTTS
jgi:putative hemolysin